MLSRYTTSTPTKKLYKKGQQSIEQNVREQKRIQLIKKEKGRENRENWNKNYVEQIKKKYNLIE